MAGGFFEYEEPGIVHILIVVGFLFFLAIAEFISAKLFHAGLLGQIAVGIIFGQPLGDILEPDWEHTFLLLGYIGLILIVFEGGLSTRLDLLKQNLFLSTICAATGVIFPIGLTMLLFTQGFGFEIVESFIGGAASSATSLGTTFAVIASAKASIDLTDTRVGTVLISAAVIDDVTGLVMASVIESLGSDGGNLGWIIGRPILVAALMAILTPLITHYIAAPFFRRYIERQFAKFDHTSNIILMVLTICAFAAIAAYAGTSILFGAYLAGTFLSYLPSKEEHGPFVVTSKEHGERDPDKSPTFVHTFEEKLLDVQEYVLAPLFFASIGFAIPFLSLWDPTAIWQGISYSILMVFAKVVVGTWVPLWSIFSRQQPKSAKDESKSETRESDQPSSSDLENTAAVSNPTQRRLVEKDIVYSSLLLGFAMVARGEIGLLIAEIGVNRSGYMSEDAFVVTVWGILVNTIIGPTVVGFIVKKTSMHIGNGRWGVVH